MRISVSHSTFQDGNDGTLGGNRERPCAAGRQSVALHVDGLTFSAGEMAVHEACRSDH